MAMTQETIGEQIGKIVIVGHVDHGKSTLLGRILMDCGQIPEDRIAYVQKICQDKGVVFEPAFFLDALQEEQEQGISIDTTRVRFEFNDRRFVLIDAPGHIEFLKNMATGASEAELGILVLDCQEGIRAQTTRHLKILSVLGITNVVAVVNKLDKIGYDQEKFERLSEEIRAEIAQEKLNCVAVVPISALNGENIVSVSKNFPWYFGQALLPLIDSQHATLTVQAKSSAPFRMLLQDVYKFDDERYFAGRVVSGKITPGTQIFFSPSGKMAKVEAIVQFPNKRLPEAVSGDSIALILSDQIFVERGEIISFPNQIPETDNEIRAQIAWVSTHPFDPDNEYLVKIGTNESYCKITMPESNHLESEMFADLANLANGTFAHVVLKAKKPLAYDHSSQSGLVSNLVICSKYETVAFGSIEGKSQEASKAVAIDRNVTCETGYVERTEFEREKKHKGTVLWLTGLSGAGKSTLAKKLQRQFFEQGMQAVVLDGDNLRHGLCAGLGFSREDRAENIRRVAQAAKLFLDTGTIVIVAVISPYAKDRELAKQIIGAQDFNEVFVFCPMEVCEERDPKGLYAKAKDGKLPSFSGRDMPYQPPQEPALRLDSSKMTVEEEMKAITQLLAGRGFSFGETQTVVQQKATTKS
jgi:bifunctional enzyme CysN/CysC